jgi:hypothetical protein
MSKIINLSAAQAPITHQDSEHFYLTIPSVSTPGFGQQVNIDIKEKNVYIDAVTLQIDVSAITSDSSNAAAWVTSSQFLSRLDIYHGTKNIETLFPEQIFLDWNLHSGNDERRRYWNASTGDYSTISTRRTEAGTATTYFVELSTPYRTAKIPLLGNEDIQLRCYFKPLAQCAIVDSGATLSATMNSLQAVAKLSKIHPQELNQLKSALGRGILKNYSFLEVRNQQFTIQQGVTTHKQVLSGVLGRCPVIYFVVRASPSTASGSLNFTAIKDFEITDNGQNVVGGTVITDKRNRQHMGRWNCNTTYLLESGANVYMYSWALTPDYTAQTGAYSGHYDFTGSQQLTINFASGTGSALTVDVFAKVYSVLSVSNSGVNKMLQ